MKFQGQKENFNFVFVRIISRYWWSLLYELYTFLLLLQGPTILLPFIHIDKILQK